MTGHVVAIRGDDLAMLRNALADAATVIRVWIDPLDQAAKFKVGNGTWSPPLGQIEETPMTRDEQLVQLIDTLEEALAFIACLDIEDATE